MYRSPSLLLTFLAISLLLALPACGDSDAPAPAGDNGGEDLGAAEEGCEHMVEGPAMDVTAAASAADVSTNTNAEHTRVDVALKGEGDARAGFVAFEVSEVGEVVFFLGAQVPFKVLDGEMEVAFDPIDASLVACDAVAVAHTVDLEVGAYVLEFGPTSEATVSFVAEHLDGHDEDHDHDHDE